jgi:oligosaccharide repeat unit polymerase
MSGFKRPEQYNVFYFIIYGLLICYSLSPLYTIRTKKNRPNFEGYIFSKNQKKILNFSIIGGLFAFFYMLPFAITSVKLGAKEIRTYVLVLEETSVLPQNVFTTIAVAFATFSTVYLAIFFLSFKSNLKKNKKIFLFVISLSYIINSLCYTARDGLLFFLVFGLIFVMNYWNTFNKKIKKYTVYGGILLSIISIYFLTSFTNDRFDDSSNGTMGYIATQPYVFAENIDQRSVLGSEYFYGLSLRFPLINSLFGIQNEEFDRYEQYEWTFGTFLTDFYSINGFLVLIIILVIFIEFFRYNLKRSRNNLMKYMLTYTFYIHFLISGLFYFRLGNFSGNVYIIIMILLIILQKNKKIR